MKQFWELILRRPNHTCVSVSEQFCDGSIQSFALQKCSGWHIVACSWHSCDLY